MGTFNGTSDPATEAEIFDDILAEIDAEEEKQDTSEKEKNDSYHHTARERGKRRDGFPG